MNKRLLTTVVAVAAVCVASGATATQSRINAMGSGVKNFTVLDERNIFHLPAELVKYGTWAGIEIGGPGYNSFGIHYSFNPTTVLALYGSNQSKDAVKLQGINQSTPFANSGDAGQTHKGTLIFGIDLGNVRLGALLGLWADSKSSTDNTGAENLNEGPLVLEFAFGLGVGIGSMDLDMALGIEFGSPTHFGPDQGNNTTISNNSQFDVGLLTRLTVPFSGPHELIPFIGFDMAFANGQSTAQNSNRHEGFAIDVQLGIDIRLNLAEGITVQPGIGFQIMHQSISTTAGGSGIVSETTSNEFAAPFYSVAVDVQVTEWLDIRFGGAQRVVFKNSESFLDGTTGGGSGESDVEHKLATGVGFNLPAGVSIDIEVDTGWWQRGPYLLTGDAGGFGLNAALSKDW